MPPHCDTMDGPVVVAAKQALEAGDVKLVLPWVPKSDEEELRRVFEHVRAVRKLNADAAQLADRFFFETLVRLHRASEGEPYTGLKPAGLDLGPVIPAVDKALESSSPDAVTKLVLDAVRAGLKQRFDEAMERKRHAGESVEAGRAYVHAYVEFMHYALGVFQAAQGAAAAHGEETAHEAAPAHEH